MKVRLKSLYLVNSVRTPTPITSQDLHFPGDLYDLEMDTATGLIRIRLKRSNLAMERWTHVANMRECEPVLEEETAQDVDQGRPRLAKAAQRSP